MQTRLPQVDKLLRHPSIEESLRKYRREIVVRVVREILEQLRTDKSEFPENDQIVEMVQVQLLELSKPSLRKVLNGTGVVLNTNLGRAPITGRFLERLKEVAGAYCNLEINLVTGKRGKRSSKLERLLKILTGAESSLAVNNCAAAIVLAVNCFALGKEVIVSRGELIEIGGSFRLPDVIEAAGGKLREVGTTNKTRLSDYEKAIGPNTGLVMRCHRSNFEVLGFTEETKLKDLVELCRAKSVPLLEDLGSGVLMDLWQIGLEGEPSLEAIIATGCDLVCFSGDKLLGGPQAGIISGRKDLLERLGKHPLYRALRLDKIAISLLEETLGAYLEDKPQEFLSSLERIADTENQIKSRVESFISRSKSALQKIELELISTNSAIGGGALPGKEKPSAGILLKTKQKAVLVAQALRSCDPPVIAITRDDDNIIDFRTIFPDEEDLLLGSLIQLESKLAL